MRFERGFAMSRDEVTVDQFRDFVQRQRLPAHGDPSRAFAGLRRAQRQFRAAQRRRLAIGLRRQRAADGPCRWSSSVRATRRPMRVAGEPERAALSPAERSGIRIRTACGTRGRYPWGDGAPPAGAGNLHRRTGRSPGGRHWANAFPGYGDGFWGPAPVGRYRANAYGLHDLDGNVSEWVADCWHDSYRRAPDDGGRLAQSGLPHARGARRQLGQCAGADALGVARADGCGDHQRAHRLPGGARDLERCRQPAAIDRPSDKGKPRMQPGSVQATTAVRFAASADCASGYWCCSPSTAAITGFPTARPMR